jgi:hypothetical protein
MSSPLKGTIELDGKVFHIDPTTWSGKDIVDFSPRASIPGGGVIYSDMSLYQPIAMLDWSHGFGFIWHTDEAGYMYTDGSIDTRHSGLVTLMATSTASDLSAASNVRKTGGLVFPVDNHLYTWGASGVRLFDGTDWHAVPWAKVAFDAKTEGKLTADAAETISHDPGVITDALVTVTICSEARSVSGITYDSAAMTEVYCSPPAAGAPYIHLFAKALGDIDGTAKDVAVTIDGGTDDWQYSIVTWEGAHQTLATAIPSARLQYTDSSGTSSAYTHTVTDGCAVVHYLHKADSTVDPALTAGSTSCLNQLDADATTFSADGCYEIPSAGDATEVTEYTWAGDKAFTAMGFIICPISSSAEINFMYTNGQYIFVFPEGDRPRYASTVSDTPSAYDWTITGTNGRSVDYASALTYGGYTWCGKEGAAYAYKSSSATLATLNGDPADDTAEIAVGAGTEGPKWLVAFADELFAARNDGLWTLDTTNNLAAIRLPYQSEYSSLNFAGCISSGGYLYYPIRNKLFKWTGSSVTDITPQRLSNDFPYTVYSQFENFCTFDDWLFYTARTSETTYTEAIIAYDGVGHHVLAEVITDGNATTNIKAITMMVFDPQTNRLWYHVDDDTADTNNTYYIPFRSDSPYAYASYPTTGTNQLVTSRIDAGFRRVQKSFPAMWIETDNCTSARYIRVKYSLDGGSWVTWVDVKTDGVQRISFPGGALSQEFNYIQFAFQFITTSSSYTPVLEGATLMVMLRPEVLYGYSFEVTLAKDMMTGGYEELRTPEGIKKQLRDLRDSKFPIKMITPIGEEVWGYISSLTETMNELNEAEEGFRVDPEMTVQVSFIETLTFKKADAQES